MSRTLYGYWRSSAAYRVRIGLNLKGLEYAQEPVDLPTGAQKSPGFTLLNPQGRVPYLIDGSTGLAQSLAILEWLDETYPSPRFLPAEPTLRARVRAAAQIIACDIHPLGNLIVLRYLKDAFGADQPATNRWAAHWILLGFRTLEEIGATSPGPYLFGDTPTLADICLVPQVYNARRFGVNMGDFPRLAEIDLALRLLPAFHAAAPEHQPDAPEARTA